TLEMKLTMKRAVVRSIVVAVMLLAMAVIAQAQQPEKFARIGYLDNGTAPGSAEVLDVFRKQMTQFNWIEGKNLAIEYRYADSNLRRLSEQATELVGLKVDVIVANNTTTTLAVKKVTRTIPIVMVSSADPVGVGLIASMVRPGGNITGNTGF